MLPGGSSCCGSNFACWVLPLELAAHAASPGGCRPALPPPLCGAGVFLRPGGVWAAGRHRSAAHSPSLPDLGPAVKGRPTWAACAALDRRAHIRQAQQCPGLGAGRRISHRLRSCCPAAGPTGERRAASAPAYRWSEEARRQRVAGAAPLQGAGPGRGLRKCPSQARPPA
nr:unnamed protein product [uncultured bacterium]